VHAKSSHKDGLHPRAQLYSWARGQNFSDPAAFWSSSSVKFERITSRAEESIDDLDRVAREHLLTTLQGLKNSRGQLTVKQATAIKHLLKCLQ
jgi:hypothetical protein